MNLFGKKKTAKPKAPDNTATVATIAMLRENFDVLEKRESKYN